MTLETEEEFDFGLENEPLLDIDPRIVRIKGNTFTENFNGSNSAVVDIFNIPMVIMTENTFTSNGFVFDEAFEKYSALFQHQPSSPFSIPLASNQFASSSERKTHLQGLIDNVDWEEGTDLIDYYSPNVIIFCLIDLSRLL
jgi:hypothetical protein